MIKKGLKSHFLVCLGITEDFLLLEHIFYIRKTFFLRYFGYMRSLFTHQHLNLLHHLLGEAQQPGGDGNGGGSTLIMMLELIVFSVSSLPHTNWLCVAKKD